jgi:hypothetical protein
MHKILRPVAGAHKQSEKGENIITWVKGIKIEHHHADYSEIIHF